MKTPPQPVSRSFNKAADAVEAWRQQQLAALTETQRQIYEQEQRKSDERQKAKENELAQRRQDELKEATRRKLMEQPAQTLTPDRRRVRLTEIQARQKVDEHFRHGGRADGMFAAAIERAKHFAALEVDQRHAREREALATANRGRLDDQLRDFERARQTQPERRDQFARAAASGKAKTDFQKSATNETLKSPAIARAIEKVRTQEARERTAREQDRDRDGPKVR